MTFQSSEAFDGFENAGSDPPQHHLATAPPLDVSLHVTCSTNQALDGVGRGERLAQPVRHAEGEDRECFLEAFTDAGRRARVPLLEPAREIVQQTSGGGDLGLLIRARDDSADPWALTVGQMLKHVAQLMDLATMDQRGLTETIGNIRAVCELA